MNTLKLASKYFKDKKKEVDLNLKALRGVHQDMSDKLTERLVNMIDKIMRSKNISLYILIGAIVLFLLMILLLSIGSCISTVTSPFQSMFSEIAN